MPETRVVKPCPRCGALLVRRKRGRQIMLGCERYPDCDYSEALPEYFRLLASKAPMLPGFGLTDK